MRKFTIRDLTLAAVLAAVYAVLTVALPIPQYGSIQVRLAEAMTVLPFFFPAATPGLFIGCVIANLFSPYPLDVVCGSAATLLASTDITPHQAFQAGAGQLALQFHAEADAARMEHWLMGHACELAAAGLDVAAIRQDARDLGSRAAAAGQDFFRRWLTGVFTA